MWSSMLEQNLVWNGGSEIEKWCGIVWTQNGGKISKTECDMGVKIKMTQKVCEMGGFSCTKSLFSATIFAKRTRNVWNGGFIRETVEMPRSVWKGGCICDESPHNMGLSEFSFSSMLLHFIAETPPGS